MLHIFQKVIYHLPITFYQSNIILLCWVQVFSGELFERSALFLRISNSITIDISVINIGGTRVSVQGVESLWGDCRFIPADWGS